MTFKKAREATIWPYPLRLISDGSAMQQSSETAHATPELVNRPSIYTLYRPCDLDHGHDKTSHSAPTTMQHVPDNSAEAETESRKHESAPENVIATQQTVLSRVSVNTSTHPQNFAQRTICVVLLHRVDPHCQGLSTATRHGHCPRSCHRNKCARAQRTSSIHMADQRQRTPIVGVESVEKKRSHMKFALPTMCELNTRPTWHMTTTNTATVLRRTVLHVAVFYETSHTDLVCPMMMFPNDMTQIMTDA